MKKALCIENQKSKQNAAKQCHAMIVFFILQNCNVRYIEDTTKAVVSVKPQWSGIKDGLLFSIKHINFEDIKYAEDLLYKLLDKVTQIDDMSSLYSISLGNEKDKTDNLK